MLIFDVLRRTKTFEASRNHDAHFGAKSFCLLHCVSGDNYRTLFSQDRDFGDDIPHKSFGLRINTG
jgi:hypothetical protein